MQINVDFLEMETSNNKLHTEACAQSTMEIENNIMPSSWYH